MVVLADSTAGQQVFSDPSFEIESFEDDPEAFDPSDVNTSLDRLKWPKVTEAALRKVLVIRDKARK